MESHCFTIWIVLTVYCMNVTTTTDWPSSTVEITKAHYPGAYCHISNVLLNVATSAFTYKSDVDLHSQCKTTAWVWPMRNESHLPSSPACHHYNEGHSFTVYYWHNSNYFHLHYDMLFPLYYVLYYNVSESGTDAAHPSIALMPTVESSRLKPMTWDTQAFRDDSKYWMQLLKMIAGPNDLLPLNRTLIDKGENYCFDKVHFGTTWIRPQYKNKDFIDSYVNYVLNYFNVNRVPNTREKPALGIIKRKSYRRIENEEELLTAVESLADAELLSFETMNVKEQVECMQRLDIIVGVNGAGLMNAVYRSKHSVAIQLVPYGARLNHVEFGTVLRTRGPYLEWHNVYEDLHVPYPHDATNNKAGTIVHIEEFVALIKEAIVEIEKSKQHDEL